MFFDRHGENQLNQFKDEFSLLRKSDYWHYLPEATQEGISALLDDNRWTGSNRAMQPRAPNKSTA
jgi:hypothetical protein